MTAARPVDFKLSAGARHRLVLTPETNSRSLVGFFRHRLGQRTVDRGEVGVQCRSARRWRREMLSDNHSGIRIGKRWLAGEKMKRSRRQSILICAAIEDLASQLFGCRISNGSHRDVVAVSPSSSLSARAIPKSANSIRRSPTRGSVSKILAGFTSRCSSRCSCQQSSASAMADTIPSASLGGIPRGYRCRINWAASVPST